MEFENVQLPQPHRPILVPHMRVRIRSGPHAGKLGTISSVFPFCYQVAVGGYIVSFGRDELVQAMDDVPAPVSIIDQDRWDWETTT